MRISEWIEPALVQAFAAEQTDAYRLCTCDDGWVERYGSDVLLSYKTEAARERLTTEFYLWSLLGRVQIHPHLRPLPPEAKRATRGAEVSPGRCRNELALDRH